MTGFKVQTSGIGSNSSANWATTSSTALQIITYLIEHYDRGGAGDRRRIIFDL